MSDKKETPAVAASTAPTSTPTSLKKKVRTKKNEAPKKIKVVKRVSKKVLRGKSKKAAEAKKSKTKPAAGTTPKETPKKVPVPETILKKRVLSDRKKKSQAITQIRKGQRRFNQRKTLFKRAEAYAAKYRAMDRSLVKLRRIARKEGGFFREPEPKIAIVIRIRGINGVDPRTKKILQLFRLRQIHSATFVKLNAATIKMLRLVEPYVTYGTPNLKTVRHLIYKRGYLKVHGQRIPICSNGPIASKFKKIDIICVEDIIHQLFTCGRHFKKVNKNLWPFKLSSPKGGYTQKTTHFQEGGDAGNREDMINAFIQRMI
jgi:60S ribosomal protein uL30